MIAKSPSTDVNQILSRLVIDDITALPKQLPKIYEQIVRW